MMTTDAEKNKQEGIIIGLKIKNKSKLVCLKGHPLTKNPYIKNGRWCKICVDTRRNSNECGYNLKANEKKRRIRDSMFPLVESLAK